MKFVLRYLFVTISLIASTTLSAQLATWEVTGQNAAANNPLQATTLGSSISSASLSIGGGITASGSVDTFGGSAFNTTTLADAITGGDYISFTISPDSEYAISVSSIAFNSGVSTAVTNFNVALLSSITGFTSANSLLTYNFSSTGAPAQSITLSGVSLLQNVNNAIEFRLYGWRDSAGTSTFRIRSLSGNDLVINGSVTAVPEPSTYAAIFGAVALLGTLFIRRRRRLIIV